MTPTDTQAPRRRSGLLPAVRIDGVPEAASGVPKPVVEASKALAEAEAPKLALEAELRGLAQAVKDAPDDDKRADQAAIEAGEDLPERTEPALRAELNRQQRTLPAVQQAYKAAVWALADAVSEHREAWRPAQVELVARALTDVHQAADVFRGALDRLAVELGVLRGIEMKEGVPQFGPAAEVTRRARFRQPIAADEPAELLEAVLDVAQEAVFGGPELVTLPAGWKDGGPASVVEEVMAHFSKR